MSDISFRGKVGPQRVGDGDEPIARQGSTGELIVQDLNGRYYEQAVRGNVFIYNSVSTGIALIVSATTGGHPTIFNPLGSGKNWIPIALYIGYVSGNNAPGSLALALTENAGAAPATGAAILTGTHVAPVSALLGSGTASSMKWYPTINTFTAAPTVVMSTGISLFTGVASTAVAPFTLIVPFDGSIVLAPGNALSLTSIQATTTSLLVTSWLAVEATEPEYA